MKIGWNTTDEDEINARKKRARKEEPSIVNLNKKEKTFSSYTVKNYLTEIRSLNENINSCSCPDIAVNRLGTCKHVEAVKLSIKNQETINKNIEIFLDTVKEKIVILWPEGSRKTSKIREKLEPFFSESCELLSEPVVAFNSLKREIEKLEDKHKKRVKVSKLIEPWLKLRAFELQKEENKRVFLSDYKNGKRSLDFLKHPLFNYQKEGVLHLAFNERMLLADEMGLGKTIQAIGASVLLQKLAGVKKVLVISPASLKTEWEEQINKFTDFNARFIVGNREKREKEYKKESFFYLANYEQILYDYENINEILKPDIIILDEAQRIKNWQTKTANSIKRLQSRYAFVLTGTPLENRIDEIYSIVQFLNPNIFGPLFRFNRDFYRLDERGMATGYKNINLLYERLKPIMLRRKKDEVEGELPQRLVKNYFVQMSDTQQVRYDEYEVMVSRLAAKARKYPLTFEEMKKLQVGLSCMRILCDTPYILDQKITISPKIDEIMPIIEELLEDKSRKIIIFSEWEKMLQLLSHSLKAKGINISWHTGSFTQLQRREEINRFKQSSDYNVFLSTDSGSVGLNLQVADTVINLDMPWNPAKLEQRIARAWRKHQKKPVQVINLITEDRIEHRILHIVEQKQFLSDNVLDGFGTDEMDLPSGRKALLKDIDKLVQTPQKLPIKSDYEPKNFVEDSVAIFSDRVETIWENQNADTIFVVVDKKDEVIADKLSGIVNENLETKTIEILEKQEFELVKKLIEKGLISINGDLKQIYSTTKKAKDNSVQIDKAKKIYISVKRKFDMAELLNNGGFTKESLAPFCESVEESLILLSTLQNSKDGKSSLDFIKTVLVDRYDLGDGFVEFIEKIRDGYGEDDCEYIVLNAKKQFEKINYLVEGFKNTSKIV